MREGVDPRLGDGIRQDPAERAPRRHRRDVHDTAGALAAHGFAEDERRDEGALEVEAECFVQGVERHVEHGPVVTTGACDVPTGGVDEDVDAAPRLEQLVPGAAHPPLIEDVRDEHGRVAAVPPDRRGLRLGGLGPTTQDRDRRSRPRQTCGDRAPQYAVAAGDDGDASGDRER